MTEKKYDDHLKYKRKKKLKLMYTYNNNKKLKMFYQIMEINNK